MTKDIKAFLIESLSQQPPFRFADRILDVDEEGISGEYTFREDEYFYEGHFPGNPVTPGVILTECMAQIGLCCHAAWMLLQDNPDLDPRAFRQFFTSSDVRFLKPVYPGEKVLVSAKKDYFRHGKIKCRVTMSNESGETIAEAVLSGMVFKEKSEEA